MHGGGRPRRPMPKDTIKVGVLATLEGAFTVLGEDSIRGAKLAFKEHNSMAGGKKLEHRSTAPPTPRPTAR